MLAFAKHETSYNSATAPTFLGNRVRRLKRQTCEGDVRKVVALGTCVVLYTVRETDKVEGQVARRHDLVVDDTKRSLKRVDIARNVAVREHVAKGLD